MAKVRSLVQAGTLFSNGRTTGLSRVAWLHLVALLVFVLAFWLPRGLALDRVVTPDEKRWLRRSGDFYQALLQGDFANTYQSGHPGVTTMWIGAAGFLWLYPAYAYEGPGQGARKEQEIGDFLRVQGQEPLDMLGASRVLMVLAVAVIMGAAFLAALRLVGFLPAFVGLLFIAADPFHIAFSRLLHLDGLASSLMLLSLLTFMNYLYRGERSLDLFISGTAAGLAWLTKSPTLFLIPFAGLLILLELETKCRRQQGLARKELWWAIRSLILWGGVGALVFVILWPAMWVAPTHSLWQIFWAAGGSALEGHEEVLYFQGTIFDGDPGFHFYPVTYLWRTTPTTMLGLGLAAVSFAVTRARLISSAQRRPLAMLLLFALLFTLFMSLGAKKFDRYLLPIYPPLSLVAATVWAAVGRRLHRRCATRFAQVGAATIVLLALAGQALSAISSFPYYLSYYNPLLGGTARAPEVMMVGWGEGLDQAARYLSTRPGTELPQVMSGVWEGTFSYFYDGQVWDSNFAPGDSTVEQWVNSDYCLIYINQWQREQLPQELLTYLSALKPVQVIRLQGLEYAYVYDIREAPPPAYMSGTATLAEESR